MLYEWAPELRTAVEQAKGLPGGMRGMHLLCASDGRQHTRDGLKAM
jgi:hypothetical protein